MENQDQNLESWDDLIFENRNKSYGAYALRQDYQDGLFKGFLVSIGFVIAILAFIGLLNEIGVVDKVKEKVNIVFDVAPTIKPDQPQVQAQPRTQSVRKTANLTPVAVPTPDPVEPDPQPATTSTGTEGTTTGTGSTDDGPSTDGSTGTDLGTVAVKNNGPFTHVEKMPVYKGGLEGMIRILQRNMKYPASARRMGKEGTVFVEFVVNDEGEVVDAKVIKGFDLDCEKQAIRMIEKLTEWTPGYQNNLAVNVKLVLPIKFELKE